MISLGIAIGLGLLLAWFDLDNWDGTIGPK
jgi:hypothetical protein